MCCCTLVYNTFTIKMTFRIPIQSKTLISCQLFYFTFNDFVQKKKWESMPLNFCVPSIHPLHTFLFMTSNANFSLSWQTLGSYDWAINSRECEKKKCFLLSFSHAHKIWGTKTHLRWRPISREMVFFRGVSVPYYFEGFILFPLFLVAFRERMILVWACLCVG